MELDSLAMNSESPEHVLNYPTDFGSVEKVLRQKGESDDNEEDDSGRGEVKRRKLENDPLSSSYTDYTCWSGCGYHSSAMELNNKKEKENIKKFFYYTIRIRNRNRNFQNNLIGPERSLERALEEDVPRILQDPDFSYDAPPEPYATLAIMTQMMFERAYLQVEETYSAVKCLYENIPYVLRCDSIEKIRGKIDFKIEPFSLLDESDFLKAVEIYKALLNSTELLFHPLIRKSFKREFSSLVDIKKKLGVRAFLKSWRRNSAYSPLLETAIEELSGTRGFMDVEYMNCCKQIELQQNFDFYLVEQKLEHDIPFEKICDEAVPKEFKELDCGLMRLSLEARFKSQSQSEQVMQCNKCLILLKEKHRKKETDAVDKMLLDFFTDFPVIFEFTFDKALDSAVEDRFKDIIDKMKETYFLDVHADYLVMEATLLYMKHILFKGGYEPQSWSIMYKTLPLESFSRWWRSEIAHDHPIYDRVFGVDFHAV